tara:strand:+ start:278 stop:463 length:186 start_codon:yes stop_codon:yes gene_type:complete
LQFGCRFVAVRFLKKVFLKTNSEGNPNKTLKKTGGSGRGFWGGMRVMALGTRVVCARGTRV